MPNDRTTELLCSEKTPPPNPNLIHLPHHPTNEVMINTNFHLQNEINKRQGIFIEVGGPTKQGFISLEGITLPKEPIISNISSTPPGTATKEEVKLQHPKIKLIADATSLPFPDNSIGLILASCLPSRIRSSTLAEAYRVLEPGGLLIWQGGRIEDLAEAKRIGFKLQQYRKVVKRIAKERLRFYLPHRKVYTHNDRFYIFTWHVVFQK